MRLGRSGGGARAASVSADRLNYTAPGFVPNAVVSLVDVTAGATLGQANASGTGVASITLKASPPAGHALVLDGAQRINAGIVPGTSGGGGGATTGPAITAQINTYTSPNSNAAALAAWNDLSSSVNYGANKLALKDVSGNATGWTAAWLEKVVTGATTGPAGIVDPPDVVAGTNTFIDANAAPNPDQTSATLRVYGLDPAKTYTIQTLSGRTGVAANDTRTTVVTIAGVVRSFNAVGNTAYQVFTLVKPAADGTLDITIAQGSQVRYAYLNAVKVTQDATDGSSSGGTGGTGGTTPAPTDESGLTVAIDTARVSGPRLGVYAPNNKGSVGKFYNWLGKVPYGSFGDVHIGRGDYNPSGTFAGEIQDWESADWPLAQSGWAGKGRTLHAMVPMFPKSGNFDDALAGKYDSSYVVIFTKMRDFIKPFQDEMEVRFGHEMTTPAQPWGIVTNNVVDAAKAAKYAALWQKVFKIAMEIWGGFRFNFCTNLLYFDWRAAWPGKAYVHKIGTDIYPGIGDNTYAAPNIVSAMAQAALFKKIKEDPFGMDAIVAFAIEQGLPWSIPEFGFQFDYGQTFFDLFWNYIVANNCADVGAWAVVAGGVNMDVVNGAIPNSGACIRYRWNPAQYPTQPATPTYTPTNRALTDLTNWTKSGAQADLVSGKVSPSGSPVYFLHPINKTDSTIPRIYLNMSWPMGQPIVVEVEMRAAGYNNVYANGWNGPDGAKFNVNLVTPSITNNSDQKATVEALDGGTDAGWRKVRYVGTTANGYGYPYFHLNPVPGGEQLFVGDPAKGVEIGSVKWLV